VIRCGGAVAFSWLPGCSGSGFGRPRQANPRGRGDGIPVCILKSWH
jgi:hypothetical protein